MGTKAKGSGSPLKAKDEQLRKAVQGSKLVKLSLSQSELASIAGISTSSIGHNKSNLIDEFWSGESPTPDEDKRYLLEKSIELGIKHVLKDEPTFEDVFGVILGSYLKVETNLLHSFDSLSTVWTIGKHLTRIYKIICRYKDKKSVSIHSENNKHAKYLLNHKQMLNNLYLRSDDYLRGKYSKKWLATELLRQYVEISTNELLEMITLGLDKLNPLFPFLYSYMSPSGDAKNVTKKSYLIIHTYNIYPNLIINIDELKKFEINSVFSLLLRTVKIEDDNLYIPVKHESTKSEEYYGRNYNIFCSLRSNERLLLGYIGYDMSAALQTISLQLIKATEDDYPMLWKYTHNAAYKKQIRSDIASDLKVPIDEVKSKLTAFAHGSTKGVKLHKGYQVFQAESDRLRKAVLSHVSENDPKVLVRAIEQSSRELPEEIDWLDIDSEESSKEMRDKSSVFFFVWTWYERGIRQAMIHALGENEASEVFEVHDAVYSKKDIDPKILEKAILEETGYAITIEKEKLKTDR